MDASEGLSRIIITTIPYQLLLCFGLALTMRDGRFFSPLLDQEALMDTSEGLAKPKL
jgi:hypothetical protein